MDFNIDQQHFETFIKNPEFSYAVQQLESQNDRFRNTPIHQKQLALYLLLNNKLGVVRDLDKILYKRPVPTIQEFLTEEYLPGHPITNPNNIWRRELFDVYHPKSSFMEHILTGAIGTAKTSTAIISQFYNLYRLTSLRSPQLVMASSPTKPLSLLLFGITLSKSSRTLVDGFKSLLRDCKYFYQVKKITEFSDVPEESGIVPYCVKGDSIEFPNSIRIISGSQVQHSIGEDLFGVIFDEAEYHGSNNTSKTTELYLEVFKRVRSRFLGRKFIMINLVSSIKDQHGVIATHISSGGAGPGFTKVSSMSIWEVGVSTGKLDKSILDNTFYVMRGTKTHPSKILDDVDTKNYLEGSFVVPTGSEVLKIPSIYRADFKLNVEQSLRDIAGVATLGDEMPFDDISNIESKRLMPVITIEAPLMSDEPLLKKFPEEMFVETPNGVKWRRLPGARRHFHLDLADTGEAAICCVHKERDLNGRVIYVVDFLIRILSPDRISLESIKDFILDLKKKLNFNIRRLTADQYQSTAMLQYFQKYNVGKEVFRLSVDRNLDPYGTLNSILAEKLIRIGTLNEARTQLNNIYFAEGKPHARIGRKDLIDALVGAVYNAATDPLDSPSDVWNDNEEENILERIEKEMKDEFSEWKT